MDVLGDAIGRKRRTDETALVAPATGRRYDYRRFCTTAWKTGNFLRHLGVRSGAGVAVADDPLPEPVLTLYGAASLGGVVSFGPPEALDSPRAVVAPAAEIDAETVEPGTKPVAYGEDPGDPTVAYFERDVWSENPTEPPDRIEPSDPLLRAGDERYSHGEVLSAARAVADDHGLDEDTTVAVAGSFRSPGVVAAGLVAPVVAGGTIAIGPDADGALRVGGAESDIDADQVL